MSEPMDPDTVAHPDSCHCDSCVEKINAFALDLLRHRKGYLATLNVLREKYNLTLSASYALVLETRERFLWDICRLDIGFNGLPGSARDFIFRVKGIASEYKFTEDYIFRAYSNLILGQRRP